MTSTVRTVDPVKSRTCCLLRRNTTAPGVKFTWGFAVLSLPAFFFAALFATLEPLRLVFVFFFIAATSCCLIAHYPYQDRDRPNLAPTRGALSTAAALMP
jgi:hypothetical protein